MKTTEIAHRAVFYRIGGLLLVSILILTNTFSGLAAPALQQAQPYEVITLPPEALSVPVDLDGSFLFSSNPKLDSALVDLAATARLSWQEASQKAETRRLRLDGQRVHVQVMARADQVQEARAAILQAGGEVTKTGSDERLLQGWLPVDALETVAALESVEYIRRPQQAMLLENSEAIASTSEALSVINAPAWHSAGFRGAGVTVAVIDGGFTGYTSLLGSELPATVTVKNFVDGETNAQVDGTSKHGAACAEIIHDMAPNAALYLVKIASDADLQQAVTWLINRGTIDIISTSLGWINATPGDGTGQFADAVQAAYNADILWATAAGNYRDEHWGGVFHDSDDDKIHNFAGIQEINYYGPGDGRAYLIRPSVWLYAGVRWDDWTNVNQDYDLVMLRWNGYSWTQVASSTDVQNGGAGQTPTEGIAYHTGSASAVYGYYIKRKSGIRNVNLEFFAPGAPLDEYVPTRSLANLADAPLAITVAALDVTSPYPQEYYSSEGPTNGPGGAVTGGFTKPNISGYANVSTHSYGAGAFNGTSSATPHVAGAAALVMNAAPKFTPYDVRSFLTSKAIDKGTSGVDNVYGYGRLYLGKPSALKNIPPEFSPIPDQFLTTNSGPITIDLLEYADDLQTPDDELIFTLQNTPDPAAGVSLVSNQYINILPQSNWMGKTSVAVSVTDAESLTTADVFSVTVATLWDGSQSSDWHTADNWTPSGVPTSTHDIFIPPSAANQPVISNGAAQVRNLTIQPGASLDLTDQTLTVEETLSNNGAMKETRNVNDASVNSFLHITNLSESQTKHDGLEINTLLTTTVTQTVTFPVSVTVSILGNRACPGRFSGVLRCYEIQSTEPITASLRFYFTDAQRSPFPLSELVAFIYNSVWIEQPGPYTSGGSGDSQYLITPPLAILERFALSVSGDINENVLFLPLTFNP